ncbi:Uncharacterised protein [Vibrio cholerae]|nr:Uncharacterised protein [Vibrio cholerae]CSI60365.1 Uncharacterised protein [Vibrio cholerae]
MAFALEHSRSSRYDQGNADTPLALSRQLKSYH